MSATTETKRNKRYHEITRHASEPYGIVIIGGFLFLAAWILWTFVFSLMIPPFR